MLLILPNAAAAAAAGVYSQVLRGMFWVLAITTRQEWHSISFGLLYWLPNPLQFGSFLLLPMAYSKVIFNACRTRFLRWHDR